MSGLIIDSEACIGCGRCVRACASGGIVVEGERPSRCARVTDGCILCGGCVDACPVNAISIERDEAAGAVDLDAYRDIWVFVQTDEHDTVASRCLSSSWARAASLPMRAAAVWWHWSVWVPRARSATWSIWFARAPTKSWPVATSACAKTMRRSTPGLICDLVAERKPEAILYGATAFGRELAPGVAVRLQTGLTADCTVLSMDAETGLAAADASGVWRQPDGHHRLPQPPSPDGNGSSRHL